MVGKEQEHQGIAKHGAKMVTAVSCAKVPKVTILAGGSFGAGNYGMCGRAYNPNFLYMWPNSRISVMGGDSVAVVLSLLKERNLKEGETWSAEEKEKFQNNLKEKYEKEGHPYHASARLWDDGVIDPRETRQVIALSLSAALNAPLKDSKFGIFRM